MATKQEARAAIAKRFGAKQDKLEYFPAYVGNEDGTIAATGGRIYVYNPGTPAIEVENGGVPEVAGLRVMVGYRPERPNVPVALGVADVRVSSSANVTYNVLKSHATQHNWGGGDPVYVSAHQITNLGVFAYSGLSVQIQAGNIQRGSSLVEVAQQTLDLTSHLPANVNEGLYVLISLNESGAVAATDGTTASDYTALTRADIPATPAGHFRLAAVRVYYGQQSISDRASYTDIFDLRWPQERDSNSLHTVAVISSNTTLSAVHEIVIVSNGSTITLPTAVSAAGRMYNIIRSGSSNVLINTTSSQTISGDLTLTLTNQWDSVVVVSDGSNWVRCS